MRLLLFSLVLFLLACKKEPPPPHQQVIFAEGETEYSFEQEAFPEEDNFVTSEYLIPTTIPTLTEDSIKGFQFVSIKVAAQNFNSTPQFWFIFHVFIDSSDVRFDDGKVNIARNQLRNFFQGGEKFYYEKELSNYLKVELSYINEDGINFSTTNETAPISADENEKNYFLMRDVMISTSDQGSANYVETVRYDVFTFSINASFSADLINLNNDTLKFREGLIDILVNPSQ